MNEQPFELSEMGAGQQRPKRGRIYLAAGAAVVLVAVVLGAYLLGQRGSDDGAAGETPATMTLRGTLEVQDDYTGWQTGADCGGKGGFSDLRQGAQIVVTDRSGQSVALGELPAGVVTQFSMFKYCVFSFEITDVPAGQGIYGVEVGQRGAVQFSESDVVAGKVALSLG